MELDEALKASKMPMIVVHFDDNFETTHTEEYNMENFECIYRTESPVCTEY